MRLPCHHTLSSKGLQVQYMLEFQLLIWASSAVERTIKRRKKKSPDSAFMKVGKHKTITQTMAGLNNFCLVPDLGITKITDFETWSRTSIQECVLELQISMAYLLPKKWTQGETTGLIKN